MKLCKSPCASSLETVSANACTLARPYASSIVLGSRAGQCLGKSLAKRPALCTCPVSTCVMQSPKHIREQAARGQLSGRGAAFGT